MKTLLSIILIIVLAAAALLFFFPGPILKAAIEKGGTQALGNETRVASVQLDWFAGSLDINDLSIANPEGYTTPDALEVGNAHVTVQPASLLEPVVDIPMIAVKGIHIIAERKGATINIMEIMDALPEGAAPNAGGQEQRDASEGGEEKRFMIREFRLSDIRATIKMGTPLDLPGPKSLSDIVLKEVGVKEGGITSQQLASAILRALSEQLMGEMGAFGGQFEGNMKEAGRRLENELNDASDRLKDALGF